MKKVLNVLRKIIEAFNIIAVAALVAMLLLVCANVVMRYIFHNPIPGTYEMTQMLMICLSPCIAINIISKQCVWVDVCTSRFGRIGQLAVDIFTLPLSVLIIGIMAWQGFNMIFDSIESNSYTAIMTFRLYEWPFRTIYFIAMTLATLAALVFTIERFMEYRNGGCPHDANDAEKAAAQVEGIDMNGGAE